MAVSTFAELETKENVSRQDLLDTFEHYATDGWAIVGHVVIGLIRRFHLTSGERVLFIKHARTGIQVQQKICYTPKSKEKNSGEYQQVLEYLIRR